MVFVQPELEVHAIDRKGVAGNAQLEVEGTLTIGAGLVEPIDRQRVAEHIPRTLKAGQGSPSCGHGGVGRNRRRRPLAVGELMTSPDRPERHAVGHHQADRRFDLLSRATEGSRISRSRGHAAVMHMVDRIFP